MKKSGEKIEMMRNNKALAAEIVFVMDRSGSMAGSEEETISGFNSVLSDQKNEDGKANLTTVLFDNGYELLHDALDIYEAVPITTKEYFVKGSTALLDAVGKTIRLLDERIKNCLDGRPDVLVIIITDGHENASHEFNADTIRHMITEKQAEGWTFIYLGADITDFHDAERIGINTDRQYSYNKSVQKDVYKNMSGSISSFRKDKCFPENWKTGMSNVVECDPGKNIPSVYIRTGERLVIDTGSPFSFGIIPEIELCGIKHRVPYNPLLQEIQRYMGNDIAGIIGMDILINYDIEIIFNPHAKSFEVIMNDGNRINLPKGEQFDVDFFFGIPVINISFNDEPRRFFLDTGAPVSYIKREHAKGSPCAGNRRDFYPMYGEFEAETYNIYAEFEGREFGIAMSVLPVSIQNLLMGMNGVAGLDFMKLFNLYLGFKTGIYFFSD